MATSVRSKVDREIEKYKESHGDSPLYLIMPTEEADALTDTLREPGQEEHPPVITTYRDIKLIRNNLMEKGTYLLCNELPETGS